VLALPFVVTLRTVSPLLVTAALAAAVLAGCGSDDDKGSLDHAQVVQQANAACKTTEARIAKLPSPKDQAALAGYVTQMAAATADLHDEILKLKPADNADTVALQDYAEGLDRANGALETMGKAAKAGDTGRVKAQATRIEQISVGVLAARAGLSACATSTTPGATS